MRRLKYSIWNKAKQKVVDCELENIYIRYDGKIGYIDTVGRFIEDDELTINRLELE